MSPDDPHKMKKKRAKDAADKHPQQPQPPQPPPDPPRMDDDDSDPGRRRRSSTLSGFTNSQDICRICHCEASPDLPLISPCWCAGSLRFVHQQCLQQWIKSSDARHCELCKFGFVMRTTLKPFRKWEKLEMSAVERRKVLCSVAFHAVAVTCVVWSLYVLIERTAEEVAAGALEWPFWTKLVVVGVGFTGGVVFMYVQCKMYVQLFRRWRAYNRIIQVQDAPEKRPQQAVFSAAAQLTTQLTSEEKRTSPDEDEFHSCESGGSSSSSSSSGSVEGRGLRGLRPPTPTAGAAAAETGSTKTTLTSVTDSLVPGGGGVAEQQHHQHHPLGEVVVVPSGGEDRQQTTS